MNLSQLPTSPSTAPACLRTPDDSFTHLPGFESESKDSLFTPHYIDSLRHFEGIRVHYIDCPHAAISTQAPNKNNANSSEPVFLCLHGNPSWSYLYRKMIPIFAKAGRVVAPDLIGFGRSDKPVNVAWHSFERHREMLLALIDSLDLKNITLVVQDWGGILGLTLPMARPERFKRLIVMNTTLTTGSAPSEGFRQWREYSNTQPDLKIGKMLARGKTDMTDAETKAYDAPFPDARYKSAVKAFPNLVPDHPEAPGADISRAAAQWWANQWRGYSFMAVGVNDPVLGLPQMQSLRKYIRGCPEPMLVPDGGHFVQEWGAPIATAALAYFDSMAG